MAHILIVHRRAALRTLLGLSCLRAGHTVGVVPDWAAAHLYLARRRPDLLLTEQTQPLPAPVLALLPLGAAQHAAAAGGVQLWAVAGAAQLTAAELAELAAALAVLPAWAVRPGAGA